MLTEISSLMLTIEVTVPPFFCRVFLNSVARASKPSLEPQPPQDYKDQVNTNSTGRENSNSICKIT